MKHIPMPTGWSLGAALVALLCAAGCSSAAEGGAGGFYFGGAGGAGGEGGFGGGGGASLAPLTASAIAVGAAHSCAIVGGGAVACWGDGAHGQLGDGASGKGHTRATPSVVPGLSGVTALRAGGDTTCAVVEGGAVRCWGDGTFGQLGDGVAADGHASAVPVAVVDLAGVVDLSVTPSNACAALADGTVRCWGRNAPDAWLGFDSADCGPYTVVTGDGGPTLMTVPCQPAPKEVDGAHDAVAVVSGGVHSCLHKDSGGVACWGADHFGQLGDGKSGPDAFHTQPVEVSGLSAVQRLALGASHTCAIAGDTAGVLCWGDNAYGQLGIGTDALDSYKITPTAVTTLADVADLHASNRTTCAALVDGTVLCWGDTSTVLPVSPQKGGSALVPTAVPGVGGAVEVRTSGAHVCARLADDTVTCWGLADRGQLGSGNVGVADFSMLPVLAPVEPPG
ncbi:MAG: hypothetical protein QM820_41325 [Minicystis sp.]